LNCRLQDASLYLVDFFILNFTDRFVEVFLEVFGLLRSFGRDIEAVYEVTVVLTTASLRLLVFV
jgi:hypothetical protein